MIKKRILSMLVLLAAVATGAWAQTYKVSVKEGTTDATNWAITPEAATTTGVAAGTTVTATYSGTKKVKSVKAVKKAAAAASLINDPEVGQIIGSDGINYDATATLPSGVTAVAMIAYVGDDAETSPSNTAFKKGLALALEDVSDTKTWSQTNVTCLGTQYDNSTKFNDLAGIANTDALVGHNSHTHNAASAARDYNSGTHPAGTSAWFLPSAGQWDKMATAANGYANLKTNAGLQAGSYWSSTESDADYAWFFNFGYSMWLFDFKGASIQVRACLAF